ncbi:complement C1q-like protein 2 [Oreochromis aureus]|uniref:C1q domain-containing protein n=1 Tax=Oreochromis aureus TaxID=47969 RepID=A0AAZ1XJW3_OREAU|nr:complement C1q-like protein 2 [Oreochromis aureus]
MEIMVFFSLLLLVCSVSTNQTEADNEILDHQILSQQPCPHDINAVLREMAVSMAGQKVRITFLEKENQDQAAKLESQKTEIERQKTETEQLKLLSKEQAAKLETEIDQLKLQSEEQEAMLESQKTETDQLKQELQDKKVAFSASLLDQDHTDTGPFNTETPLIFKHAIINIGNAYNLSTGIFTAPVRGVYHFGCKVYGHESIQTGGLLFKNGEKMFLIHEHQKTAGGVSAYNGVSLLLEVGDEMSVRLWPKSMVCDSKNHHTTFSGHLVFTM